jgi:hypothetical protein
MITLLGVLLGRGGKHNAIVLTLQCLEHLESENCQQIRNRDQNHHKPGLDNLVV